MGEQDRERGAHRHVYRRAVGGGDVQPPALQVRHTEALQRAREDRVRRRRADRRRRALLRWYRYRTGVIGRPWVRVNGRARQGWKFVHMCHPRGR
jgi:hypothetical protein